MIDNEINSLTAEYKQDKSKKDANKAKIDELQNTKKSLYERAWRDKENLIEVVKEFEEYVKDLFFEYDFSTVEYDYKFNLLLQDTLLSLWCQIKKPE